jgi:hypothetical protein
MNLSDGLTVFLSQDNHRMPTRLVPLRGGYETSEQELDRLIRGALAESVCAAKPSGRLRRRIIARAWQREKQPPREGWAHPLDPRLYSEGHPLICQPYAMVSIGGVWFFTIGLRVR